MKKKNLILLLAVGTLVGTMLTGCGSSDEVATNDMALDTTEAVVEEVTEEVVEESIEEPTEEVVVEEPTEEVTEKAPEVVKHFGVGDFSFSTIASYTAVDEEYGEYTDWSNGKIATGTFNKTEIDNGDGTKTITATITAPSYVEEDGVKYWFWNVFFFADSETGLVFDWADENNYRIFYDDGTEFRVPVKKTSNTDDAGIETYTYEVTVPVDYMGLTFGYSSQYGKGWASIYLNGFNGDVNDPNWFKDFNYSLENLKEAAKIYEYVPSSGMGMGEMKVVGTHEFILFDN